jgi:hypothetical protein
MQPFLKMLLKSIDKAEFCRAKRFGMQVKGGGRQR